MHIATSAFSGISPKLPPRYLPPPAAQVALDCEALGNSLKPLNDLSAAIKSLATSGTKTIYKFGQDTTNPAQHWFSWAKHVDVARSQIAGDGVEWTFFTGDGYPKATNKHLALGSGALPSSAVPLGIPAPTSAPTATEQEYVPETEPATLYISASQIKSFTVRFGLKVSLDGEKTYPISVALSTDATTGEITAEIVAAALNGQSGSDATGATQTLSAVVSSGGVEVKTSGGGRDVSIHIKYSEDDYTTKSGTGSDASAAQIRVYAEHISRMRSWSQTDGKPLTTVIYLTDPSGPAWSKTWARGEFSQQAFQAHLNASGVVQASIDEGDLLIETLSSQVGSDARVSLHTWQANTGYALEFWGQGTGSAPAEVKLTAGDMASLTSENDVHYSLDGGKNYTTLQVSSTIAEDVAALFNGEPYLSASADGDEVTVKTDEYGAAAQLIIAYRASLANILSATGKTLDNGTKETRVYVYTWVARAYEWDRESAPSPASTSVDVYPDQHVTVSGLGSPPTDRPYGITHQRIYRAVDGAYLFVTELDVGQTSFTDDIEAAALGEEIPSLYWTPPPDDLEGIINLPNGIMAGFVGRDVFFCDPYHPHAWPDTYRVTVDYPVVGLGGIDTTLVVLTTGTPYFIQGSHPDSMVVVKTDLEQSCIARRSIVSAAGSVLYASPDGLVSLAPSGSRLLTEAMFTRDQWQATFNPASIHAYDHDLKYFAFYILGATRGGFVLDLASGSLTMHSIYQDCGFSDLRSDTLFLASGSTIKAWNGGEPRQFRWRSKRFVTPQITGLSCMQVEAEGYPIVCRLYRDGELIHTQTVASRTPFRLPARPGRDWEFELEGRHEVFNVALAQSMEELAGV